MVETSFGQPMGGIIQVAYVVEDIERDMLEYAKKYNIGPWYYTDRYTLRNAVYRGEPTDLSMKLCIGFSGHMMFELIEPNDTPSVYQEIIQKRGHGFHHLGMACSDFDADVEKYLSMGYANAFSGTNTRDARLAYFDTQSDFPGMLELIEMTSPQDAFFGKLYEASLSWDGKSDPIRTMSSIVM